MELHKKFNGYPNAINTLKTMLMARGNFNIKSTTGTIYTVTPENVEQVAGELSL